MARRKNKKTNSSADAELFTTQDASAEEFEALKQEVAELREALTKTEENRDEYKSKYFQFKGIFQRQTHTFYLYQGLSESTQSALSGIFKGTSFEEFLACGVQPGNIDALWEFTRNHALQDDTEDLEILVHIITYFVKMYNSTNDTEVLKICMPKEGDTFDTDLHIRTPKSKAAGSISEVLLFGLSNGFTGDIIKKAVVTVK